MDFKSDMVLQDMEDNSLWLLDFSTQHVGQYGSGLTWDAKSVVHNERTGEFKVRNNPPPRFIDSINHRDKYRFYAMSDHYVRWYLDATKTQEVEQERQNSVLKSALDKLSPAEREVMMKFAKGGSNGKG